MDGKETQDGMDAVEKPDELGLILIGCLCPSNAGQGWQLAGILKKRGLGLLVGIGRNNLELPFG